MHVIIIIIIIIIIHAGQTALDLITDYDDWIRSGFFDEQVTARLKGQQS